MVRKIQIGKLISGKISEKEIQMEDIAKKLEIPEPVLSLMLKNDDIGCNILFKLSQILEYDFFRHYSHYLKHDHFSENGNDMSTLKKVEL